MEVYVDKMQAMIDDSNINTLTVVIMEVPCCSGLVHMAKTAVDQATRKVPLKAIVLSLQGQVIKEDWV